MPIRTRADMHIGIDLALESLDSTPMNRLDPAIKDYFLNRTISEFVKSVITKANQPDENKRVPFRLLTYGDILSKYNDIYTLIKVDTTLTPLPEIDNSFYQYTLPTDLFKFESSFSYVRPIDCIALSPCSFAGGTTIVNGISTHTDSSDNIVITNLLLNTYDIISFNNNPFGGKKKYIGTILTNTGLQLYHLGRYVISKIGIIYIKKPAVLTSSPTIVNCDLPESTHDKIVDDTVKFIAATATSGNYEQLLMEAKLQNQ